MSRIGSPPAYPASPYLAHRARSHGSIKKGRSLGFQNRKLNVVGWLMFLTTNGAPPTAALAFEI
jgi:hypothetical protein